MDLKAFNEHLDRYGADIERWPDEIRMAAGRLIEESGEALRLVSAAGRLDLLLHALPIEPAPAGLGARILAALPGDGWQRLLDWFVAALWRPALAASLALALGFLLGVFQREPLDQDLIDDLSLLAFSDSFRELPYEH